MRQDKVNCSEINSLNLIQEEHGLTLTDGKYSMRGDFTKLLPRLKQQNLEREILVRAVRIKNAAHPITVLDATAGMGEDSLILAAAGYYVLMYEVNPVIARLLGDTLERSAKIPELAHIVGRMTLHAEDSIEAMHRMADSLESTDGGGEKNGRQSNLGDFTGNPRVDVVLLDPMFPERQKSSLVKKKFQLLQQLEHPCRNEEELLDAALAAGAAKIVIKRPAKGGYLAGVKPDYSIGGKAVRYDCILPKSR